MAVRRTKKDKIQAQVRREQRFSYSLDEISSKSNQVKTNNKRTRGKIDHSLLLNDPALILKDLRKTVLVSGIILGLLLASYSWLR